MPWRAVGSYEAAISESESRPEESSVPISESESRHEERSMAISESESARIEIRMDAWFNVGDLYGALGEHVHAVHALK